MKITENLLVDGLTHRSLNKVKGIVVHWVANPNTSAINNRNYWENLGSGVGAHYIIDLNGDVIYCVPNNMMAYHVGAPNYTTDALNRLSTYPNNCTVGIECTHVDNTGKMTSETYRSLVQLANILLKEFQLDTSNLWLHSEIVGKDYKDCHRWFTTTKPSDWIVFKHDVANILGTNNVLPPEKIPGNTTIKSIQSWLNNAYHTGITVDGIYGGNTKKALVKALQTELNIQVNAKLIVDGIWGVKTESACITVDRGDRGNITRILQSLLYCNGYDPSGIDGIFGQGTEITMKKYQHAKGLIVDGKAGKKTFASLCK